MGFSMQLVVLSKQTVDMSDGAATLWFIDEIIDCDRVSRDVQLCEMGEDRSIDHVHPHLIAGTSLMIAMFNQLPEGSLPNRPHKPVGSEAPPFLERRRLAGMTWDEVRDYVREHKLTTYDLDEFEDLVDGMVRIVPQRETYDSQEVPDMGMQMKHNRIVYGQDKPDNDFADLPCWWQDATTLVQWIDDFWDSPGTKNLQLENHPRSKAKLVGWHEQFRAYAAHDAKVLFLFT